MFTPLTLLLLVLSAVSALPFPGLKGSFDQLQDVNNGTDNKLPYVFTSKSLPEDMNYMPTIGNGHLGFTIFQDTVFLNGIFNGKSGTSHRARIPNYGNIQIEPVGSGTDVPSFEYSLDVQNGIFQTTIENSEVKIVNLLYAHRYYNRAIINEVYVYRNQQSKGAVKIKIRQAEGPESVDIAFNAKVEIKNAAIRSTKIFMIEGLTKEVEDERYQKSGRHVCVLWNAPEEITLEPNQRVVALRFAVTIDDLCSVAEKEIFDVLQENSNILRNSHASQWTKFWENYKITVSDLKLGQAIYGSAFYLASSLPSFVTNQPTNPFYGLSPSGLGRGNVGNDYMGHSFWDTEIWMLPAATQMDPRWTKELLSYRYRVLEAAKSNAKEAGLRGVKFPWESGFTGVEVTPPCCPDGANFELHITADISIAVQNYLATANDINWFMEQGCPIAENVAEFWASRVQLDSKTGLYDIANVLGPDEDNVNVTNNVYTNAAVKLALEFGDFAVKHCKSDVSIAASEYLKIADNLKILHDEILDYHPEYEGYVPSIPIKQADAVLLGYPLNYPMNISTRRNDLEIYERSTRETGPAMTWAIHAINNLDIGNYSQADKEFERGYGNYVRQPFQVWSEVVIGETGSTNFITGAGGFLQAVINGYAGVRIHLGYMEIHRPRIPPNSKEFSVSGIKYLGSVFRISVDENQTLLYCLQSNSSIPLKIIEADGEKEIKENTSYAITMDQTIIKPKQEIFKYL